MTKLYRPKDLLQFLEEIGAAPNKRLSQNFLIDGNILRKIVEEAHITPGDWVLEIGPGPGALTQTLLKAEARVVAVEKDPLFAEHLQRLDPEGNSLKIYAEDVKEVEFSKIIPLHDGVKSKVVANLPYHLTSVILGKLFESHALFSKVVVMVQKEVAERMVAGAGSRDYSALSIFLSFYATPKLAFEVSSHCFLPKPKVDSAVVVLDLHQECPQVDAKKFFDLIHTCFSQRRKMLRGSLKHFCDKEQIPDLLSKAGIADTARPEEVSLEQFLHLYSLLNL